MTMTMTMTMKMTMTMTMNEKIQIRCDFFCDGVCGDASCDGVCGDAFLHLQTSRGRKENIQPSENLREFPSRHFFPTGHPASLLRQVAGHFPFMHCTKEKMSVLRKHQSIMTVNATRHSGVAGKQWAVHKLDRLLFPCYDITSAVEAMTSFGGGAK